MNYEYIVIFLFVLHILPYACGNSFQRHVYAASKRLTNERHRKMHLSSCGEEDCMFNICEQVDCYPGLEVDNIIKKHPELHSYFDGYVLEPVDLITKDNEEPLTTFCKTTDVTVAPRTMQDVDGIQRIIVNTNNYTQLVKYQKCDYDYNRICYSKKTVKYQTACVQKFYNVKLATVDFETQEVEYRQFRIPSTCVGIYTETKSFCNRQKQ